MVAQPFEGTIEMRLSGKADIRETTTIKTDKDVIEDDYVKEEVLDAFVQFHVKGDRTLVVIEGKETKSQVVKFLFDRPTGDYYIFAKEGGQENIIKQNMNDPMMQNLMQRQSMMEEYQRENYIVEPTGKTKMIGAFECMEYLVESNEGTAQIWVTHDFQFDTEGLLPLFSRSPMLRNTRLSPIGKEGFIMEMVNTDRTGKKMYMTNTVIKQHIDSDLVAIPKSNKTLDVSSRMQIIEEYKAKMMKAKDDPEELQRLGEELKQKIKELEKQ